MIFSNIKKYFFCKILKTLEIQVLTLVFFSLLFTGILNKFQSAYTAHKSTETALTYILSDLHLSSSHKDGSILTLLDLSSAFDTLDHNIMISRLTSIGITGTPLKWFTSYLTNRHHYIKIDNHSSTSRLLTHGVPHGSVLGPILLTYTFYHYSKYSDPTHLSNSMHTLMIYKYTLISLPIFPILCY